MHSYIITDTYIHSRSVHAGTLHTTRFLLLEGQADLLCEQVEGVSLHGVVALRGNRPIVVPVVVAEVAGVFGPPCKKQAIHDKSFTPFNHTFVHCDCRYREFRFRIGACS